PGGDRVDTTDVWGCVRVLEGSAARTPGCRDHAPRGLCHSPGLLVGHDRPRPDGPGQKKRARADGADPLRASGDSVRVHSGCLLLRPSGDEAPDDEYDERTADRAQPGRQREELIHLGTEDGPSEPAAEHGSDDTDDECGEDPAALFAGKDRLGDGSRDESEDQICDETHDARVPSETGDRLWSGHSGHGKTAARGSSQDALILYDIGTQARNWDRAEWSPDRLRLDWRP